MRPPRVAGILPVGQRVARSFPERWPALSLAGRFMDCVAQGHQLAHRGGAARSLPLSIETKMDAKKTRGLVLLAALSLVCATLAWSADHAVFTSVFAALGTVAVLGAAAPRPRR